MPAQVKQDENGQLWVRKDANSCWVKAQRTYNANGELIVHLPPEKVLPDGSIAKYPDEQGYNGWSNYETWAVNLHLTNDQSLYRLARYQDSADLLKEWVMSEWELISDRLYHLGHVASLIKGLCQDLLTSSLQSVNWYEIYEGLHEEDESED